MAEPLRMCLITREMKPKKELIRLCNVGGKIVVDKNQKIQARGVYISNDSEALKKFKKSKCLNRAFKMEVPESVYDEVLNLCQQEK